MTSATERIRALLDERGVEWDYGITGATTTRFSVNGIDLTFTPMRDGLVCSTILTPEQAIAATLGSPVNTFTLDEIEDLYKDLCDSDGGTLMAIVDGVRYETDWGYGVDSVRHFIDMLRRRHRIEVDA